MHISLSKKNIVRKTVSFGGLTMLSRLLGIIREFFMVAYLGPGIVSDAFFTAFKIPNSLRKIFAEGALSAAFIPTLVSLVHAHNYQQANALMSLAFILFEGVVLLLCALVMVFAHTVISFIAPGFSPEAIAVTVPYVQILMPFIFFISSSALLASSLQAVGHFFVPAFSPVLLNIVFIGSLFICTTQALPVEYLCWFILFGGLLQLMLHVVTYWRCGFTFGTINNDTWHHMNKVWVKFLPCLFSMSIMEISLFIDTSFASYLPDGSITLIYYANRFMQIPLGVFGVAFSTILLPHFSRVGSYAPKRLGYYLLESAKIIFWVMMPVMIAMIFFSEKIFSTIFLSTKFTQAHVVGAAAILVASLVGLFFFAFNKIILNVYYGLHNTKVPALIAVAATVMNIGLNYILMIYFGAVGLALATSFAGIAQTIISVYLLKRLFGLQLYIGQFSAFAARYVAQLALVSVLFGVVYYQLERMLALLPQTLAHFFLFSIGFWLWVGPLVAVAALLLYVLRKPFGLGLHFLDE